MKGEKRFKVNVNKVKTPDSIEILNDRQPNTMYHCILSNTHAIVLVDEWIFDSTQAKALPRNELHLRYSAESYIHEHSKNIILVCYKYWWQPEKSFIHHNQLT